MTNRRDFLKLAIWASFLITINKISKVSEAEANPSYIVSRGTILYNILDLYVTHRLEDLGDGNHVTKIFPIEIIKMSDLSKEDESSIEKSFDVFLVHGKKPRILKGRKVYLEILYKNWKIPVTEYAVFSKDGNYLVYYEIGTEDKFRDAAKVMIRNNSIHFGKISVNGRIVKLASCVDSCTSHDDCAGAPYMGCYPYCCSIDIECCAEECIYCLLCLLGSKIGCLLCLSLCTLMCLDSCCTQEANSCTSP